MDYSKFTAEYKDAILLSLCESFVPYAPCDFNWKQLDSDCALVHTCLKQFEERGFILDLNFKNDGYCWLGLTSRAIDFINAGGFRAEHEIFDIQMSKAMLELEKLQSDPSLKNHIQKIAGITGIISDAVTTFRAITGTGML